MTKRISTPTNEQYSIFPLAPVHLVGAGAIQLALSLSFWGAHWPILPLVLFLFASLAAPFFPQLNFFLPIICHGKKVDKLVAITFDDGPDPSTTPVLLDLLSKHSTQVTFFVVGNKAEEHPELIRQILARGHEIANHSYSHDPLLMLRRPEVLAKEIEKCQTVLSHLGVKPFAFRPPICITNPYLFRILIQFGMYCIGFSRRARDFGNCRVAAMATRLLPSIRSGDIILLHDKTPRTGVTVEEWQKEVDSILTGIKALGLYPTLLSRVIQRPVMETCDSRVGAQSASQPNVVRTFYEGLAEGYDEEQDQRSHSVVRSAERNAILGRLPKVISSSQVVLEVGAGTGRFTLEIARKARKVVAVDLSPRMLQVLMKKADKAGLKNIEIRHGDICSMHFQEVFDIVCAFSCLEYIIDLTKLFQLLSSLLKPGGKIYLTLAHRSYLRFFGQLGNAMRQGIWLHARSRKEIIRMLRIAGFTPVEMSTHAFKLISSGVLLEVLAIKDPAMPY
jgi:peptidoglycan-N-acetylglucosamine deacetylase